MLDRLRRWRIERVYEKATRINAASSIEDRESQRKFFEKAHISSLLDTSKVANSKFSLAEIYTNAGDEKEFRRIVKSFGDLSFGAIVNSHELARLEAEFYSRISFFDLIEGAIEDAQVHCHYDRYYDHSYWYSWKLVSVATGILESTPANDEGISEHTLIKLRRRRESLDHALYWIESCAIELESHAPFLFADIEPCIIHTKVVIAKLSSNFEGIDELKTRAKRLLDAGHKKAELLEQILRMLDAPDETDKD